MVMKMNRYQLKISQSVAILKTRQLNMQHCGKSEKKICVANIMLISAYIVLVEFRVFSVGYLEKQTEIFKREVAILCNIIFIDMFVTR